MILIPWESMTKVLFLLSLPFCLGFMAPQVSGAQSISFTRASRIRIEGRATTGPWKCVSPVPAASVSFAPRMAGFLVVPVETLECGNPRMNHDMFRALRSSSFPSISFHAVSYDSLSSTGSSRSFLVTGTLEVAGVRRPVVIPVEVRTISPSVYRATGSLSFRMTEYGVKPPVALFGLIKAQDRVTVFFDLTPTGIPSVASLRARE